MRKLSVVLLMLGRGVERGGAVSDYEEGGGGGGLEGLEWRGRKWEKEKGGEGEGMKIWMGRF